jgi:putative thioredoxin
MEQMIGQSALPPDAIKDSDLQHFTQDVLVASREVPVIVDFWAPWCGPCKQLTPVLEKVVRQAGGKVKLVKVNVDENQAIAQQLRIQSIPAVFAFKNGQPVDGFAGALPESQVKAFVQRLTGDSGPSEVERAVALARQAREAGEFDRAVSIYGQVLRAEPDNPAALGGLAQCYVANGDMKQAREVLDAVPAKHANDPEVAAARAAMALAEQAENLGDMAELQHAVEANPADHQARYDLSLALVARGEREQAVEQLLAIVRADRNWNEQAARKQLVTLFEAFGHADPLTIASRRRLSSLLFS